MCCFSTSIFSGLGLDFGTSWASKMEPIVRLGLPGRSQKPPKPINLGACVQDTFQEALRCLQKGSQRVPRGRFWEDFSIIWEPFFDVFGFQNPSSQPILQVSYLLAGWRHHFKSTYWKTSSHMSKEGRRYVRSTENFRISNGSKIARIAPISTILGRNRSQRPKLFFPKFSRRRNFRVDEKFSRRARQRASERANERTIVRTVVPTARHA